MEQYSALCLAIFVGMGSSTAKHFLVEQNNITDKINTKGQIANIRFVNNSASFTRLPYCQTPFQQSNASQMTVQTLRHKNHHHQITQEAYNKVEIWHIDLTHKIKTR